MTPSTEKRRFNRRFLFYTAGLMPEREGDGRVSCSKTLGVVAKGSWQADFLPRSRITVRFFRIVCLRHCLIKKTLRLMPLWRPCFVAVFILSCNVLMLNVLQKLSFCPVKGILLACERIPFMTQKDSFCNMWEVLPRFSGLTEENPQTCQWYPEAGRTVSGGTSCGFAVHCLSPPSH